MKLINEENLLTNLSNLSFDITTSNICYSNSECVLLAWINFCYFQYRQVVWSESDDLIQIPTERLIVNFDKDFRDGVVLGCLIGAYIPCLVNI